MKAAGLAEHVGIYIWDHNKERAIEFAAEFLDGTTMGLVDGIAFHCYSGDHFEAVRMLKEKYPDKTLMLSECCEMHSPGEVLTLPFLSPSYKSEGTVHYQDAAHYAHDIIGNLNAGMNRWIDWNLLLDRKGGPRHVRGGCTAPLVANDDGSFYVSLIHHYISHFSKYIQPGAKRIGFSKYSDAIEMTAVKNPDGQYVMIFLNQSSEDKGCALRINGKIMQVELTAHTISTIIVK
jgi:O-Glycosyl hydrolase